MLAFQYARGRRDRPPKALLLGATLRRTNRGIMCIACTPHAQCPLRFSHVLCRHRNKANSYHSYEAARTCHPSRKRAIPRFAASGAGNTAPPLGAVERRRATSALACRSRLGEGGRNGLVGAGLGRAQTGDPPRHSSRRGVTSNILRNATASFRHGTI